MKSKKAQLQEEEEKRLAAIVPYPALPVELAIYILYHASFVSHATALSVSLVCKASRREALPQLFSTIVRRTGPTVGSGMGFGLGGYKSSGMLRNTFPGAGSVSGSGHSAAGSHMFPPSEHAHLVRNIWIESIDMMSSPGELGVFNACANVETVAMSASSLRMLYNSTAFATKFGPVKKQAVEEKKKKGDPGTERISHIDPMPSSSASTKTQVIAIADGTRVYSITLTKPTFRYDWHFLVDLKTSNEESLLGNITHLRLTDMRKSAYVPLEYLYNLTHIALPYLQLRTNRPGDLLKLPDGLLERPNMEVIVLTVDAQEWLYKPWTHRGVSLGESGVHSPREKFKVLQKHARSVDERVHVVLAPRLGCEVWEEWAAWARKGSDIWQEAVSVSLDGTYADILPEAFPPPDMRLGA